MTGSIPLAEIFEMLPFIEIFDWANFELQIWEGLRPVNYHLN